MKGEFLIPGIDLGDPEGPGSDHRLVCACLDYLKEVDAGGGKIGRGQGVILIVYGEGKFGRGLDAGF